MVAIQLNELAIDDLVKITLRVTRMELKVKCDHRSKFSNLSNWKEEA